MCCNNIQMCYYIYIKETTQNTTGNTYMLELLKALLEDMFKNVHGDDCGSAWAMHDDDLSIVTNVLRARRATTSEKAENAIGEFMRIDSKTKRVITEGFLIWGGVAYFKEEVDAVEYLNTNGFACTAFNEAYEAAEAGEMDECFHTDWFDPCQTDAQIEG